jgi:putative transposase
VERGLQRISLRPTGCTRRRLTDPLSDDLVHRQFRPDAPDQLWMQDVTQHPTGEGWVYLAEVIDAWSRRVFGLVDRRSPARRARRRRPRDGGLRRGPGADAVAHSDHGCQYTSWPFGQRLRCAGLLGSMGTIGDALDNAVAESFFASLRCELLDRCHWATRAELARAPLRPIDYEAPHGA